MEAEMEASLVILVAAVIALNAFAVWYGTDSRDGEDWTKHDLA